MSFSRCVVVLSVALGTLTIVGQSAANPIIIGLGAEGDTADSRAFTVFTDIGLTDDTWISGSVGRTDTDRDLFDLTTLYADVGIDHHFDPVGIRLTGAYWGDEDLLESKDVRGAIYLRGERGSVSAEFERRNFDLTVDLPLLDAPLTVDFSADGIGLSGTFELDDRVSLYAGGMDYDYSRDIRIQPNVDTLRFFSLSRLSMVNSLVDFRASVGLDVEIGQSRLDFRIARWRTEVDQGEIDSYAVGFLTPAGNATDVEFRLAYDDSENFGGATVFSVFIYLFDE